MVSALSQNLVPAAHPEVSFMGTEIWNRICQAFGWICHRLWSLCCFTPTFLSYYYGVCLCGTSLTHIGCHCKYYKELGRLSFVIRFESSKSRGGPTCLCVPCGPKPSLCHVIRFLPTTCPGHTPRTQPGHLNQVIAGLWVLEVVVLVCVSCPNVQSVLGGPPLFASAQRHLPGTLCC